MADSHLLESVRARRLPVIGELLDPVAHFPESLTGHNISTVHVRRSSILASADGDEVWVKPSNRRINNPFEKCLVTPVTRAGRKRDVERVPLTVTLAKLLNRALLWMVLRVPGAVIVVRAHEEHIIAVIECLLCTITMVDVPVDYRNPVGCDVGRSVSSERSLRCESATLR